MTKLFIFSLCIFIHISLLGQNYQTPRESDLPQKLDTLDRLITVTHFPTKVHPIEDDQKKGLYYWKHNTAIYCETDQVVIEEFGAYIYYNGQWNLRVSFPAKELDKLFGTKKAMLKQAQPYTYVQNWRYATEVSGGWAMWYFIGKTRDGKRICGYQPLETTDTILPKK